MGLRIIISFFTVLGVFCLVYLTFSISSTASNSLDDYLTGDGIYTLYQDSDKSGKYSTFTGSSTSSSSKKNNIEFVESGYKIEKFNYVNRLFFKDDGSYEKSGDSFSLSNGEFFFYLMSPTTYNLSGTNFNITLNGPVKFYINISNNDFQIFSFDNIVNLTLLYPKDDKKDTENTNNDTVDECYNNDLCNTVVYVYPHMYYKFPYSTYNQIKVGEGGVDPYRVFQMFSNEYVKQRLYKGNTVSVLSSEFFYTVLDFCKNENYDNVLNKKYIFETKEQNSKLNINKNKMIVYHKNNIYNALYNINYNNGNISDYVKELTSSYNYLLENDPGSIEEMKSLITLYYMNLVATTEKYDNFITTISSFNGFLSDKKILNISNSSNYLMFIAYNSFEKEDVLSSVFFNNLTEYLNSIINVKEGDGITKDRLVGYDSSKNSYVGYCVSFMKKLIIQLLNDSEVDKNNSHIYSFFRKYSAAISDYPVTDNKIKKSIIVDQLDLLSNLERFLRNKFFKEDLDDNGLLQKDGNINGINLSDLNNGYDNIYKFYSDFRLSILKPFDENDDNDNITVQKFESLNTNIKLYISALEKYDKYVDCNSSLYDGTNKNCDNMDNSQMITELQNLDMGQNTLTEDSIKTYFLSFSGVDEYSYNSESIGDNTYMINFEVNGIFIEFSYSPLQNNMIKYTKIAENNVDYSFSLKNIEQQEYSKSLDKDFKNYFIDFVNEFNKPTSAGKIYEINDNKQTVELDPEIELFKKNDLLSQNGELGSLKSISNLSQYNVNVTNSKGIRTIELDNVKFEVPSNVVGDNKKYSFYLSGKYFFSNTSHYFYDTTLKLLDPEVTSNNTYLFEGMPVKISENINRDSLRTYVYNMFSNPEALKNVYETLTKEDNQLTIESITKSGDDFTFNIKNKSKKDWSITINKTKIVSIKNNGVEKLDLSTSHSYLVLQSQIILLINK